MVAAAVIGGSVLGGYITSQGAQSAAQTQANAATSNEANVLAAGRQASQMDLNAINSANAPLQDYVNLGNTSTGTLGNLLTGQNSGQMLQALQNMPGYQFQLKQGLEAAQNGFAARGLGSSGAAMKGAADYASGLANQNYQNFFNNNLSTAQLGAGAAGTQSQNIANLNQAGANALMGSSTNAASLGMAGAAAAASGQAAAANALGNGIANAGQGFAQYSLMNNVLNNNALLGGGASMYGSGALPMAGDPAIWAAGTSIA